MKKYTTSHGHNFSTGEWLDLHFDACKFEYEEMVKTIPIQPGWRVLDAGSGNGRFLNVLSKLVTKSGEIDAIDLAQENIDDIHGAIKSHKFEAKVSATVGDVTQLNFPDNTFDLVWCANVTQYLDKSKLEKTITEFKRVLKPGGTVAIKETDGTSYFFYPTKNFTLLWDSIKLMSPVERQRWFDHPLELSFLLHSYGFTHTRQSTHLIERRNPLDANSKKYLATLFNIQDVNWSSIEIQTSDNQQQWIELLNQDSPTYILSQPNFYWREGHILATGNK
jgi:ubiquinone/menaquinone biosynthesis C-methylase UbiE